MLWLYRVNLFKISKSPYRLGPQSSFIDRLFRNEVGECMKTQVRHPDVRTCTSTDNNHTNISSLAHSHLKPAISIYCVDTYGIDFPWQHSPSIATNIGRQSHHVDTEHNHFCLSAFFLWHNKKNTMTRGCPVGCDASSLRFNVNLILSLEMLSSAQPTGKEDTL